MSVIEQLYYGNIPNCDKQYDKQSDYGKALAAVAGNEEKLLKYFKNQPDAEEETKALKEFVEAQLSVNVIENCDCFTEGFKLGAKFTLEMFMIPGNSSALTVNS
ncbi:MAG: hypothetical protein FWG90_09365 [Oscillospiraceae bacterium]|nr:hypothetical protein [Oscillospiraceae bacterium]